MNSLLSYHYPQVQPQYSAVGTTSANSAGRTNNLSNPTGPTTFNANNTKLPSIHSLALPTNVITSSHPQPQQAAPSAVVLPPLLSSRLSPPTISANGSASYSSSYTTSTTPNSTSNLATNSFNGTASIATATSSIVSNPSISPVGSPSYQLNSSSSPSFVKSEPTSHTRIPSPLSSSVSNLSSNDDSDSNSNEAVNTSFEGSDDNENSAGKKWKPRKKRQCPECKLFFSNLATHKSTHLKPTSRPHICKYCNRGFARSNDLFRHIKCHWKEIGSDKGQFKCPFKHMEVSAESTTDDNCCHQTGIFSRCDTFKNHLKAIHFQYPNGTKKDQRTKVAGKCRMCQTEFKNVDDWLSNHIEKNQCPFTVNMLAKE
ncbi:uncharacterized protein RJT21DRAFT_123017 [Scheffersomyces amazonensis]|uniref:uncharacterized protein n=1 Tax=Scheffersomyces amazonensis TaxID=1078765 RepID=UPI00315DFB52